MAIKRNGNQKNKGGRSLRFVLCFWSLFILVSTVFSHEMNTAYLELREHGEEVGVLIRVPEFGHPFILQFPEGTEQRSQPIIRNIDGGTVKTWRINLPGPLAGSLFNIGELSQSDLLVRIQLADQSEQTLRLTPADTEFCVGAVPSQLQVAGTYLMLGTAHILEGVDHLLFVLALLLLVNGWKKLTGAITTFTLAHSITLALAALGLVHVPGPPVEAIIALSIVFVACEIVHSRQGRPGITERAPWLVTLTFGLLHGLGFAGALSEIGLPQHAIPAALLFFNLGVEAGQVLFVATVLLLVGIVRRVKIPMPEWTQCIPPYIIGSIAMFWVIERVAGF